ncbi:MAG TPA: hypothetical protein VLJ16_13370 [Acidobacteriota bacterium]|nr:hypothetical protein [Acidobacteriota bacterium]
MTAQKALILASAVTLLFSASPARADLFLRERARTETIQPSGPSGTDKDQTRVIWIRANRVRMDQDDGTSSIFFVDRNVLCTIDHDKKQYREIPLNFKISFEGPPGRAPKKAGAKAPGFMNMSAKVTETDETGKIGAWNCRMYAVEMTMGVVGTITSEYWATEDIPLDPTTAFVATNVMWAAVPGFENVARELKKIRGLVVFQVSTTKSLRGVSRTTRELLECAEKPAPAGIYDLPAGYKKVKR